MKPAQAGRKENAKTTSRLKATHTGKGGRIPAHDRAEQDGDSAAPTVEDWHCRDAVFPSLSHEHPNVGQAASIVVKKEPEETPPAPTDESMYCDDFGRASTAQLHSEGRVDGPVSVKEEPDELAHLRIHEGSCSGTFDCTSSVPPHPGNPWVDGRLHVIEVPDAILPTPTDGGSRYGDRGRPLPSQLDLKEYWNNNCIVKEEQVDLAVPPAIERSCLEEPVRGDLPQAHKEEPGDDSCVPIQPEVDEADATSTSEGSDCEDADDPSSSPEPASGVQMVTVGVEKGMARYASYTSGFKLQVVEHAIEHGNRAAARHFGVEEVRVRYWKRQREKLQAAEKTRRAFRGPKQGKFPRVEEEVLKYVTNLRKEGRAVSREVLQNHARTIAKRHGISVRDFRASDGWITRFMQRNGLCLRRCT
uniref:Putative tigger transposase n=1 Tax=Ixodes ricinus TaxID=34613 RepID=A0A147BBU3_IXORI